MQKVFNPCFVSFYSSTVVTWQRTVFFLNLGKKLFIVWDLFISQEILISGHLFVRGEIFVREADSY